MSKSLTNKLYLKQRLYSLKMAKGSNLSQHINMFNQIIGYLKRVDVKFEELIMRKFFLQWSDIHPSELYWCW
jgi:hypothetical protein